MPPSIIPSAAPHTSLAPTLQTGEAEISETLDTIDQARWDSTPTGQRAVQFKSHFDKINAHWNTILNCLDLSCQAIESKIRDAQAGTAQQAGDPGQSHHDLETLRSQLGIRKAAWQRVKTYVTDKTEPKMLDLFYLNQTRQHLQTIAEAIDASRRNDKCTLAELTELSHGLAVCKEGVALNIMECAGQLYQQSLGNQLHALYKQSRQELIHQLLLSAVRASHATAPDSNRPLGLLTDLAENQSLTMESVEIHEVQALRNALSEPLGLDYIADRHISVRYQDTVGRIAQQVIPRLVTTHAVAMLVAEKLLQRTRQILELNGQDHSARITNTKHLDETLLSELGIQSASTLLVDTVNLKLLTVDELSDALVQSGKIDFKEHSSAPVPAAQRQEAIQAFLGKGKLPGDPGPRPPSPSQYFHSAYQAMVVATHALKTATPDNEEEKRRAESRLELTRDSIIRLNSQTDV